MTIVQLEYIIAVDTHRHFAKAAASCFITQPTLSAQIHKLEEELGVVIFDRSKQPVIPTAIGERLIEQAKKVVKESKMISNIIAEEKGEISGVLKLGIIPTLAPYLLPLFIKRFLEKYPNVNLQIEELVTEDILKRLKDDNLDIGLVVTPLSEQGILEKPIFYEEFYAYLSKGHTLLNKPDLHIKDLEKGDVWLLQQGHCFREQVLNLCNKDKQQTQLPNFQYESGSLEGLKRLVDKHEGITLLPELATLELNDGDKARLRSFAGERPTREVSLVLHRSFLKRKLVDLLYAEILNSLPAGISSQKPGQVVKWR